MEEKTNKKLNWKRNKTLNGNQENAIKLVKKIVQDLKTEIEAIKKTQTEGTLEMENLDKWPGTTEASINNKTQEMEEKISSVEDMIEKIDLSAQNNVKSNTFLTQNIQEIWDTIKKNPKNNRNWRSRLAGRHRKYIQQNHRWKLSQP